MSEHSEVLKSNHIQMGHASAKHLAWTQLGQCKSAETRGTLEVAGILLRLQQSRTQGTDLA